MRNDNINRSPKKANRINQRHSWCIFASSTPKLISILCPPPPPTVNDCIRTSVTDKKTHFGIDRQSFIAPLRSLSHMENVWAILFAGAGGRVIPTYILFTQHVRVPNVVLGTLP